MEQIWLQTNMKTD